MAGSGRKVWAADEVLAAADLQDYIQDQVVFVYNSASARTSGILAPTEGMISYLKDTNALEMFDGSSWVNVLPNTGTAGTYTKVTTDAKGRVTSGTTLSASDIPVINASSLPTVITSGNYTKVGVDEKGRVVTGGTLTAGDIPTIGISQVSNLQSTLDSKQTAGGTFSGTISTTYSIGTTSTIYCQDRLSTSSTFSADGQITSPGCRVNISGPYNVLYVNTAGQFGIPSSTERMKQDIVPATIDTEKVCQLELVRFRYKEDVAENGDDAHVQLGLIAEQVEELIGPDFVFYNEDGQVQGIHFEMLSFALLPVVQEQQKRLKDIEARLAKLEK